MNQITQQNAAASEELAANSEEISGQTEQLQSLMSFFKVEGETERGVCKILSLRRLIGRQKCSVM
jgi:hypothetical protein